MQTKYTVLLLYPDYMASNEGTETFHAWVQAGNAENAILYAQCQALDHNDIPRHKVEDFKALAVYKGHNVCLI